MIPVTIISGFLGAGKTTLLNRLLREAPEKLAVLVNDFAEINVDIDLVESRDSNKISLSNGCVCCTIKDDLLAAALELQSCLPQPDRIVIETSGVSDPFSVAEAFLSPLVAEKLRVEGTICVVDAENFDGLDFTSGELAIDQAAVADIVLLNKCDLASAGEADKVETTLRDALPSMRIVRTRRAEVPWSILLGAASVSEEASGALHSPPLHSSTSDGDARERPDHDHGGDFKSWSWSGKIASFDAFKDVVRRFPTAVLRAKGIVRFEDLPGTRGVFQQVGKRSTIDLFPEEVNSALSRLVLIARSDQVDPAELNRLFGELGYPGPAGRAASSPQPIG
jgi:G3E family GTPase